MNAGYPERWNDATRIPSAGEDEVCESQVESCPIPSPAAPKWLNFCAHVDFLPFFLALALLLMRFCPLQTEQGRAKSRWLNPSNKWETFWEHQRAWARARIFC